MDDDRLAQLLHDAVPEPPPATFDADDVLRTSRKLTARRQSLVRGGGVAAIVLLAVGLLTGLGVVGAGWFGHTGSSNVSSGAAGPAIGLTTPHGFQPKSGAGPKREGPDVLTTPPMQGGGVVGSAGQTAGNTPGGCGSTDGELAIALARELPSVGEPKPVAVSVPASDCPVDTRSGAAYSVHDNSNTTGTVVALLRPAADTTPLTVAGAAQATVHTSKGDALTVLSQPQQAGGLAPFADNITSIATSLAGQF